MESGPTSGPRCRIRLHVSSSTGSTTAGVSWAARSLLVIMFASGWACGRLDLLAPEPDSRPHWLRGNRLLLVCAALVLAGSLYLQNTAGGTRLIGPSIVEQPAEE